MEVGHQDVDDTEAVARRNEDIGRARPSLQGPILTRRAFEQPERRRADGYDPPAPRAHLVQGVRGFRADVADLGMHLVVVRIVRLHRQKRPRSYMQRHEVTFDAGGVQRSHQFRSEMQPRCRRGNSTFFPGVDGLIILAVALIFRALARNIGRQGNLADCVEHLVQHRP
jgi:hypothetical protein